MYFSGNFLAKNYSIYVAATIKRNSKGFPESLKGLSVQKGEFVSKEVGDVCYTLFSDHKDVCFVTNAFPEHLESPVPHLQKDGVQYVPALLPAYNKFIDRSNQLGRIYDFDRKSVWFWKRLFYKFFHFAVNNAYILYKCDCQHLGIRAKDLLAFRLELVRTMLDSVGGVRAVSNANVDTAQNEGVCYVERLCDISLKRGRCLQCVLSKRKPPCYTSFGCRVCRVRLCKTGCFQIFHQKYKLFCAIYYDPMHFVCFGRIYS